MYIRNDNLEFSNEQLSRIDYIYEATLHYCKILTEIPNLDYDISIIGPIADAASDILVKHGFSIRFPYMDDNGIISDYITED